MGALEYFDFEDVSLTRNGQLLSPKLPVLLAAGIKRINVFLFHRADAHGLPCPQQAVIIDGRGQTRCPTLVSKKQVESHIAFQSTVEVPSCLPMPSKQQVESGQKSQTAYRERPMQTPDQEGASDPIRYLTYGRC